MNCENCPINIFLGFPPLLGYRSGLFDSSHRLVMEDVELQEDPHKHTADDLSSELDFRLLNLVCFMGSLMFQFCLYLIAFVFVVLRRSWFPLSAFYKQQ